MIASDARPRGVPDTPGVYRFRDDDGRVIYVGKAKSLRSRLASYFADPRSLHPRTRSLMEAAADVDWTVVGSEVEALQLEYAWIKEFDPRFNVRYRDDKSYPYLAVSMGEEFPRALVTRGAKRPGTRYFGPYAHAWAIRGTLDALLRVFPIRTCSRGVFDRARRSGRPCLLADIGKCSAPCVGRVTPEEHRRIAEDFCSFMAGRARDFQRRLTSEMLAASQEQDYERAARLRDDIGAMDRALERNSVVFDESVDADVVGMASDDLEVAFEVFHVRDGRIRGQRSYIVERVEDADEEDIVGRLLV
ncbi:MAG: excinuclease ABC subunit UvrC, partial [Candidatus Nanopelagicales bacterium]